MAPKLSTAELLSLDSAGLQKKLDAGLLTSVELVQACLAQVDKHDQRGAKLNAMISVAPHRLLMERSAQLDRERTAGRVRSPFHGIPVLVKDAIATSPSLELATTLGSLALRDSIAPKSANIVAKVRAQAHGELRRQTLTVWNSWRRWVGDANSNGWSALGGQTQSAYIARRANETGLGQTDPCGSSTGSAVGVSAGYAPLSLGTESIGSIVMPASRAGLYAFKPALSAVSMDGVFKSSLELDVVGGLARSPRDLALLSQTALTEEKRRLLPEDGYLKFLTGNFNGIRTGFLDPIKWSLHPNIVKLDDVILKQMNEMYFAALNRIKECAAEGSVVYPVDIPPATDLWYEGQNPIEVVMSYEAKQPIENWLAEVKVPGLKTIEDLISFNLDHKDVELPESHPDQNQLLKASRNPPPREMYETVKARMKSISKDNGIDKLFREQGLNILAFPMDSLMVFISAASGYPIATIPLGVISEDGRPYGLGIMAQAGREDLMFQFMSAFEAHFPSRVLPIRVHDNGATSEL
ncbi:hypothetical protein EKO27_g10101 [Xylaria grammica]|uniref:Amidase domain-containing protein n=1 Tax=Xylaria grammica TaxID=363999 RepID=A0A439CS82_9PEZI|nr:hypothetical protein EKO27_g10101 [Xylaria grammica]